MPSPLRRSSYQHKPRLFRRQQQLLGLLSALGGHAFNLDFQKLLFLYCQESAPKDLYDFVPYRFGAFSFTSYADRRKLTGHGLLEDSEEYWRLTDRGTRVAYDLHDDTMERFAQRYRGLRGKCLVGETYRRFPFYAIRSEIVTEILGNDDSALRSIARARSSHTTDVLSTIGYEGRTIESFLKTLLRGGVTLLYDIRRNPISRKYGFSKKTLKVACRGVGIRYVHLPELGIASEDRRNLKSEADYDRLFATYKETHLSNQGEALSRILRSILSGERVALTCFERLPEQCHRYCVATALENDPRMTLRANHL